MDMNTILSILEYIITATGVCAWIATQLSKAPSNKWLALLYKLINFIGGNVFHATNKKD
jgi:hypothetical protein